MSVTKQLIDFNSIFLTTLWKSLGSIDCLVTQISSFVFSRRKIFILVWNDLRMN